jgi:uncharacterized membrane protein
VGRTLEISKPNWVTALLLMFAAFAMHMVISALGAIPCIGPLISLASILIQPYFSLIWAVAYCRMTRQRFLD